jgi:DNA-binding CsgD family transcriptional regulator
MKESYLDDLRSATSGPELLSGLMQVGNALGFNLGALVYRRGRLGADPVIQSVSKAPDGWRESSRDLQQATQDPVFSRLQSTREPFFYDAAFYSEAGAASIYEEVSAYGYVNGVSASLHLPGDRAIFWGFDREEPLPAHDKQRVQLLSTTQLIGVVAASAVERILGPSNPLLSPAQRDALQLARRGCSSWHIGELMGLTEDTVNYHLKRCRAVLGVRTRLEAVHKAVELGLIE